MNYGEISRRTVLAGTWAAPVIAYAASAPRTAASIVPAPFVVLTTYRNLPSPPNQLDVAVWITYGASGRPTSSSWVLEGKGLQIPNWTTVFRGTSGANGRYLFSTSKGSFAAFRVVATIEGQTVRSAEVPVSNNQLPPSEYPSWPDP
jgi:hypothetical protein